MAVRTKTVYEDLAQKFIDTDRSLVTALRPRQQVPQPTPFLDAQMKKQPQGEGLQPIPIPKKTWDEGISTEELIKQYQAIPPKPTVYEPMEDARIQAQRAKLSQALVARGVKIPGVAVEPTKPGQPFLESLIPQPVGLMAGGMLNLGPKFPYVGQGGPQPQPTDALSAALIMSGMSPELWFAQQAATGAGLVGLKGARLTAEEMARRTAKVAQDLKAGAAAQMPRVAQPVVRAMEAPNIITRPEDVHLGKSLIGKTLRYPNGEEYLVKGYEEAGLAYLYKLQNVKTGEKIDSLGRDIIGYFKEPVPPAPAAAKVTLVDSPEGLSELDVFTKNIDKQLKTDKISVRFDKDLDYRHSGAIEQDITIGLTGLTTTDEAKFLALHEAGHPELIQELMPKTLGIIDRAIASEVSANIWAVENASKYGIDLSTAKRFIEKNLMDLSVSKEVNQEELQKVFANLNDYFPQLATKVGKVTPKIEPLAPKGPLMGPKVEQPILGKIRTVMARGFNKAEKEGLTGKSLQTYLDTETTKELGSNPTIKLYRGITSPREPQPFTSFKEGEAGRYWSTNLEYAKRYVGKNGEIYSVDVKASELANRELVTPYTPSLIVGESGWHEYGLSGELQKRATLQETIGTVVKPTALAVEKTALTIEGGGIVPPVKPPTGQPPVGEFPPEFSLLAGKPEPGKILGDLSPFQQVTDILSEPNTARKVANLPGIKTLMGTLNPSALAETGTEKAIIGRVVLRAEGRTKATSAFQTLAKLGTEKKVFGAVDDAGRLTQGPLKGLALNDVRTYPGKYAGQLTDLQKTWIAQANTLEKEKLAFLKRNGIEVNELSFEEGGQYAGRRVYAKISPDGELLETARVGVGPGRPGAKLAAEKTRVFKTADEAIKEGYRYLPEEDSLFYNLQGAYNRVADKQMSEWLLEQIEWRTTKASPELIEAAEKAKQTLNRSRQLAAGLNRAVRGERLPTVTINSIARDFPEEAGKLKALIPRIQGGEETAAEVQALKSRAAELIRKSQNQYYKTVTTRAKAAEMAKTLKFGEARVQVPAFQGKILTGPDAQEIAQKLNRSFSPEYNRAMGQLNKVNAVMRFFQLAADASIATIQLIFQVGQNPVIYGKSLKGFTQSLFDTTFQARYLAENNALIQQSSHLILSKGGTEFTEALARGGLLRTQPLSIGGKMLEPFQRGFEGALDVAGVELRKSFAHLCTTPERTAQVEQFINEFRGLADTQRLGVSPIWRQVETATLLAPRYNRSIASLLFDVAQGNLRGDLARKSLARGVAAIAAMTVVISYAMGENPDEIADHLNPNSKNFMTWKVKGQNIGPGSKVRSVIKLWADCIDHPEKLDPRDKGFTLQNPTLKFVRGNLAPVAGDALSILTGKTYIGDPVRDTGLDFLKTIAEPALLPLWVQEVALNGGDITGRGVRALGQFAGLRTYPVNKIWDLQDKWSKEISAYDKIPSDTKRKFMSLAEQRTTPTKSQYRKSHPEVDAKLFIIGDTSAWETPAALMKIKQLMTENKLKPDDIKALKKRQDDLDKGIKNKSALDVLLKWYKTTKNVQPATTIPQGNTTTPGGSWATGGALGQR